jgi:hypothetical protein
VTVQLQSGQRLSQQVSPLQTLTGLYDSLTPAEGDEAIVSLDFGDISEEKIEGEGGREGGRAGEVMLGICSEPRAGNRQSVCFSIHVLGC